MSDTALDKIIHIGTAAARAAFTPSPGTSGQLFIWVDNDSLPSSDPATWIWDSGSAAFVQINAGGTGNVNAGGTLANNDLVIGQGTTAVATTTTGTGILTFLGTPSSANLAAALTDETGSGAAVFANTPTLVTPILGTPNSGTLTNCTGLPPSGLTQGGLIGFTAYAAGTDTTLGTTSGTNMTDMDATNAQVTFTAPASGNVWVRFGVMENFSASGDIYFGLRESTSTVATCFVTNYRNSAVAIRLYADFYITGVSAGSHTYKAAHKATAGSGIAFTGPTYGQVVISVYAMP